jgi:tetratricopeptide (TPR) repeat protein
VSNALRRRLTTHSTGAEKAWLSPSTDRTTQLSPAKLIRALGFEMERNYFQKVTYRKREYTVIAPIYLLFALTLLTAPAPAAISPKLIQGIDPAAAVANSDGARHLRNGRYREAVEAFDKAIRLQPDLFEAYYGLGIAYQALGQHDEAVRPFNIAVRLRPLFAPAYYHLGEVYFRLTRYELAVEALKKAIDLKFNNPSAYSLLGYAAYKTGRWDEAIKAYNEFIKRTKENTTWERRLISWFNLYLSRGEMAASQAISNLKTDGWQEKHSQYNVLIAYLGYRQANMEAEARKILDEASVKVNNTEWPYSIIRYLRHEITVDELLALADGKAPVPLAGDNGRMTEARTFIGVNLLLSGRREEALTHLTWVKENGKKDLAEYALAMAELSRIAK